MYCLHWNDSMWTNGQKSRDIVKKYHHLKYYELKPHVQLTMLLMMNGVAVMDSGFEHNDIFHDVVHLKMTLPLTRVKFGFKIPKNVEKLFGLQKYSG